MLWSWRGCGATGIGRRRPYACSLPSSLGRALKRLLIKEYLLKSGRDGDSYCRWGFLPVSSSVSQENHEELVFAWCVLLCLFCVSRVCSLLCLPAFSSVNVLLPFLFSSRLHLIHAWALLVEALGPPSAGCGQCPQRARCPFTKAVGPHAALLEERLRGLLQDQTLSPHDRVLCIR